ncbi:MAG: 3-isopropylmalate dehydratase large subunit [Candidatus Diapherotrites archaeon]
MSDNLFNKVWQMHEVQKLPNGESQLFIGTHLMHEVTSPQAFAMLREKGIKVAFPERTFATADHIIPTENRERPFRDSLAEEMMVAIEKNTSESKITFFGPDTGKQGVIHVIAAELGLAQPGMTIACGDSHTSTHGAFGAIAFGIGTSQIRDVLASQCISIAKPKVRKIEINGSLAKGVFAKDVILRIIKELGVKGGLGYAYEYSGKVFEEMNIEERMTVCNMSIEGGARAGYINPDEKTFSYLKGKEYVSKNFEKAKEFWKSIASDSNADYGDIYSIDGSAIEPMVTWGITPGQAIGVTEKIPKIKSLPENEQKICEDALQYMGFNEDEQMLGKKINVAFIGSCTNGRISDLREAAKIIDGKKVASNIRALVVSGSQQVKKQAEEEGLDKIFIAAGFEWRDSGCSMCLAMNPDKLNGREICASTSNRNFKGRQGSTTGRTILMSPAMVAAAAINGKITDVREIL